jgi:hypothetical protein
VGDRISLAQARFVALYGRVLTDIELFYLEFFIFNAWQQSMKKRNKESVPFQRISESEQKYNEVTERQIDLAVSMMEKQMSEMFMKAVREHDRDRIIEIADAVWFFKDKLTGPLSPEKPHEIPDKVRNALLGFKEIILTTNFPRTIEDVRQFVGLVTGDTIEKTSDGNSSLRRQCKELGIELARTRKIRSKKSP